MKAWLVSEWCEPEALQLAEVETPEPKAGEGRIRNHAAALCHSRRRSRRDL